MVFRIGISPYSFPPQLKGMERTLRIRERHDVDVEKETDKKFSMREEKDKREEDRVKQVCTNCIY